MIAMTHTHHLQECNLMTLTDNSANGKSAGCLSRNSVSIATGLNQEWFRRFKKLVSLLLVNGTRPRGFWLANLGHKWNIPEPCLQMQGSPSTQLHSARGAGYINISWMDRSLLRHERVSRNKVHMPAPQTQPFGLTEVTGGILDSGDKTYPHDVLCP